MGVGGAEFVSSGAVATDTHILGGTQTVLTGASANTASVGSGGTQIVDGGTASSASILAGGDQIVSSGGTSLSATLSSGGTLVVRAAGSATSVLQNAGGAISATTLADLSGSHVAGATSTAFSIANNLATGMFLENGGTLAVLSGGTASASTVNSGGTQIVANGGSASLTTVNSGGIETVSGMATSTTVNGGGQQSVSNGGVSYATTLMSGGIQNVTSGGVASSTNVNSGGTQNVFAGALAVSATMNSGAVQNVLSAGTAIGTEVNSGAVQNVKSGATVIDTTVQLGGVQNVSSGSFVSGTTIADGGTQSASDGTTFGTTVKSGGSQQVGNSGAAVSTVVAGGALTVSSGGITSNTTVNGGGSETLLAGASATDTVVNSGGTQSILGGGVAYNTKVNSGALQYVDGEVEGYAFNATVSSGGTQEVAFGGTASGTLIEQGAVQQVDSAGTALGTIVEGTQLVSSGGNASATTVQNGGVEHILAGGYATNTQVSSGTVIDDGTADNLAVGVGATITGAGTIGSDLTLANGSTLNANTLGAGLTVRGTLTFSTGSTYAVNVNASGQTGVTAVAGNLQIQSGVNLAVSAAPGDYSAGAHYAILSYTGSESGSFASVQSDLAYLSPTVTYGDGVVEMTFAPTTGFATSGFSLPAGTANQNNVARALSAIYATGGNALTTTLLTASKQAASSDLAQVAGEEPVAFREIAEGATDLGQQQILQNLTGTDRATAGGLWVAAGGQQTQRGGDAALGASAYQDSSAAVTIGHDQLVGAGARLGGALTVNDDSVNFSSDQASGHIDGAQLSLYGTYAPAATVAYVTGVAGVGFWNNAIDRTLSVGALGGRAHGVFHTSSASVYGETGLTLDSTVGTWQPYAGIRAGHYTQQGFTESGADQLDLAYSAANSNVISSVLGLRLLESRSTLFGRPLDWQVDLSWQHRLTGTTQSLTAAFAGITGPSFEVRGAGADRNDGRVAVGANWQANASTSLFAHVVGEVGSNSHYYGVNVGARWSW